MTKVNQISREQFEVNKELKTIYGSYENYLAAQLKTQSIHTFAQTNPNKYTYNLQKHFLICVWRLMTNITPNQKL